VKDRHAILLLGVVVVILGAMCFLAQQDGYVDIRTPGVALQLNSAFGPVRTLQSESGTIALPARAYKPVSLELRRKQGEDTWQMSGRGPWGQLSRVKVGTRRTTTIELGPPLLVKPEVAIYDRQVNVDLGIFGRSGEKYTNLICKNNRRIKTPEIRIVDEAGAVLVADKFQYG
jgi:hypothetical protein